MMANEQNPFREFRAEQMGLDLWRMYVPGPFEEAVLSPRALVIEGGRGSGKTMFFLYNSWRQQIERAIADVGAIDRMVKPGQFVGVYYKVDTGFVTSMFGHGRENWIGVFSTYLGVSLIGDILEFLRVAVSRRLIAEDSLRESLTFLGKALGDGAAMTSLGKATVLCEDVLNGIESLVNNPQNDYGVRATIIGRLVSGFVDHLMTIEALSHVRFRVFIDEYETLLEYQQRAVNTLVKHSDTRLVYSIGMRPKGMINQLTLSDSEVIQDPHDYDHYRIELMLDSEHDRDTRGRYRELLREICGRRFRRLRESLQLPDIPDDIEYYLGQYVIDDEIQRIAQSRATPPFRHRLEGVIRTLEKDECRAQYFVKRLAEEPPPLTARLHLCLLLRRPRFRPSLDELLEEYESYLKGAPGRYQDWLSNTKLALVFLLSGEYKKEKLYYGFDVYAMLSSGVIRYFLELCERAVDFAVLDGFSWRNPRRISPEQQTSAARFVSGYKIRDITGYAPYGRELRMFIQELGSVFRYLHHNLDATLGEPEPNHFRADELNISERAQQILKSGVMWAVFQDRRPTKDKSDLPTAMVDYHLNHIYCPYYDISYRHKRKIEIQASDLEDLLSGEKGRASAAQRQILQKYGDSDSILVSTAMRQNELEMELPDRDQGGD